MPASVAVNHQTFIDSYLKTGVSKIIGTRRIVDVKLKNGKEVSAHLSISETQTRNRHTFTATVRENVEVEITNNIYTMYNEMPETVIVINPIGIIQYCNSQIEKLLGFKVDEIMGKNIKKLMPNEYAKKHDGYLINYKRTGTKKVIGSGRKIVAQNKFGSPIPIHLTLLEQKLGTREVRYIGLLRQIEIEELTETLLQSERNVIENLISPGIIVDNEGVIQAFNSPAQDLFGFSYIEVIARNISMLMNAKDKSIHNTYLKNYSKTGKSKIIGVGREVIAQKKDGTQFRVSLSSILIIFIINH